MSTLSGKPFDPFDLSPYAPKRARERSGPERPSFESSGYQHDLDDQDYTGRGDAGGDDAASVSAAAAAAPEEAARPGAGDLDFGDPVETEAVVAAAAAEAPLSEGDLDRLQSTVRHLRREAGLDPDKRPERHDAPGKRGRLPRAGQLAAISGLGDPDGPHPRSEQYINGIRVPPSLAPERLRRPRPLQQRRDHLRGPLRVLLASVVATPIAYYFSVTNPTSSTEPRSTLASFAARLVSEFPLAKEKLKPEEAEAYDAVVASRNKLVNETAPSATAIAATPVPAAAPAEPAPQQTAAAGPARALDDETVKLLLQQGEQLVAAGDLISARQVYRRAAEGGNAAAALALGATYDPMVLARIGMPSTGADVEKARSWYEKAKEFGSADARSRLETLAKR